VRGAVEAQAWACSETRPRKKGLRRDPTRHTGSNISQRTDECMLTSVCPASIGALLHQREAVSVNSAGGNGPFASWYPASIARAVKGLRRWRRWPPESGRNERLVPRFRNTRGCKPCGDRDRACRTLVQAREPSGARVRGRTGGA
jgi:hypothetical protein